MSRLVVAAAGVLVVFAATTAWFWRGRPRSMDERPLTMVLSGDTSGWIAPCGCAARQSGGLLRRGTFLDELRTSARVVYFDVGGSPAGDSTYDRLKFEAILAGEMSMGVAAHNLGGPEAALGGDYLREFAERTGAPFVATNLRDAKGEIAPRKRIIEAGGERLLVLGVLAQKYARAGLTISDPSATILEVLANVSEPYDDLIVLAYLPEIELRALATKIPEADVVAGGPTGQAILPTKMGPTLLVSVTNKGRFLGRLERDQAGAWSGALVEMSPEYADSPRQTENLGRFHAVLGERDLPASATGMMPLGASTASPGYAVAGNESCRSCHPADCSHWEGTKHALAWRTLNDKGYHVDSYCQQCHTTGFGLPGGFESARRSPDRRDVGCESCHGPSQAHRENPALRTPFAARDQCVRCHDPDNSPTFNQEEFWKRIVHGAKSTWKPK